MQKQLKSNEWLEDFGTDFCVTVSIGTVLSSATSKRSFQVPDVVTSCIVSHPPWFHQVFYQTSHLTSALLTACFSSMFTLGFHLGSFVLKSSIYVASTRKETLE
jgi:hypothetical protein